MTASQIRQEADTPTEQDRRWTAVLSRDRSADGTFYYAVKTTGVYCRPSCAARRPNRQNVDFYNKPAQAEAAGFRPCKKCKPSMAPINKSSPRTRA